MRDVIPCRLRGAVRAHTLRRYSLYRRGPAPFWGSFCLGKIALRGFYPIGPWHKVSAKQLSAYFDEMTFRFNNRLTPYLFRDTLLKLIEAPVLEYKKLTGVAA